MAYQRNAPLCSGVMPKDAVWSRIIMKHQGVDYDVQEDQPGLWRWIIRPPLKQGGLKVVGDAKHRTREAAVASAIEEINNGFERSRTNTARPTGHKR